MSIEQAHSKAVAEFEKALQHLKIEYSRLQLGRANASLVENILVEAYGVSQPIKAVAGISIPDPRTIQIQPWDKGNLGPIEKGILASGIGLNPVNDGMVVRISIPALTEERRADLTKRVHKLAEEAKISVRTARQDAHKSFKQSKEDGETTEDDLKDGEKNLQGKVDEYNKKIEETAGAKEKDVMTI